MHKRLVEPIYLATEFHLEKKRSHLEWTWDTKPVRSGYLPLQEALSESNLSQTQMKRLRKDPHTTGEESSPTQIFHK
jgi:hypothetical protein